MKKLLAMSLVIAGAAATLSGCAYEPYAGPYAPAGGYRSYYTSHGTYGYPAYARPAYRSPVESGGGYGEHRGGDWDHRRHEEREEHAHQERYRADHREGGHPVNLGGDYRQRRPEGSYQSSPDNGQRHRDGDRRHDRDRRDPDSPYR